MAVSLENLIDLNLLTYYDGKIKEYIAANAASFEVITELPEVGEEGKLYFVEGKIYYYNEDIGFKALDVEAEATVAWNDF